MPLRRSRYESQALSTPERNRIGRLAGTILLCMTAAVAQPRPLSQTASKGSGQGQVDFSVSGYYLSGLKAGVLLAEAPVTVNRFLSFAPAIAQIGPPAAAATQIRGSVTGSLPVGRVTIENRNLFLHQFNDEQPNVTLYRNRTMVSYLVSRRIPFRLFVFEEVFHDWHARAWNRNWSSAGGSVDLGRHLRLQVYYMRQLQHGKEATNIMVYGVGLRLPKIARLP